MTDQTGSYGSSEHPPQPGYGGPVPGQWAPGPEAGAYGQAQPYGATQQFGQTQHTQHFGQPQYGQPQYGAPQPYGQYGAPQPYGQYGAYGPAPQFGYGPPPRPSSATVITAAVIQIVQASLFVIIALAILLVADVVNSTGDEVDRQLGSDVSDTTDSVSRWVAVGGLLLLAGAIFMIVLAALAIRGKRWAAITSVVLQGVAVLFTLVGLVQSDSGDSPGFGIVFLLASIAAIVFFLLPASSAYFAARAATGPA